MPRIVARLDELPARLTEVDHLAGAGVRAAWRDVPAAMSGQSEEVAGSWRELAQLVERARAARRSERGTWTR